VELPWKREHPYNILWCKKKHAPKYRGRFASTTEIPREPDLYADAALVEALDKRGVQVISASRLVARLKN